MADKKAVSIASVDKRGRVVCPICKFVIPVPETHALSEGTGMCPNGHAFIIDETCVQAFHYFLTKAGSDSSKQLLKNREDTPKIVKDLQDGISEGGIHLPR